MTKSPTDKNNFDDMLKNGLHRDIFFRMVIWSALSLSSGYFAVQATGNTALEFFVRTSNSITPLINTFGLGALLLCIFALMLKDVEATSGSAKVIAAMKGMPGGFVRRTAGDLSLWALGATNAMLSAVILALIAERPSTVKDLAPVISLIILLVAMFIFLAIGNVWVRRNGPSPVVTKLNFNVPGILIMWASIPLVTAMVLVYKYMY